MNQEIKSVAEKYLLRKPALKTADVPPEVHQLLNEGLLESRNLVEWLVVDHAVLIEHTLKATPFAHLAQSVQQKLKCEKKLTAMQAIKIVAGELSSLITNKKGRQELSKLLSNHPSDSVRCWACMVIGQNQLLSMEDRLKQILTLVDDPNSGVREIAWMGMRECCLEDLETMLALLQPLTLSPSPNIRRYVSELTRPCGVWCKHLTTLKSNPEIARPLLEPLKADTAKYVRDSVGNWLNDASKSQPGWVRQVCQEWQKSSNSSNTAYIIKKALRTINIQ